MMRRLLPTLGLVTALALVSSAVGTAPAHADQWRDAQWYLETLDVEAIHDITTGEGITIGLVDSGVNVTHPDLVGADIVAVDGYGPGAEPLHDERDHGTSMASLIVGQGHGPHGDDGVLGILPDATLYVSSLGWDDQTTGEVGRWQAEAFDDLIDLGVDVITTSISTGGGYQEQQATIERAEEAGIPVVISAGNNETLVMPGCDPDVDECWEEQPTESETVTYDGMSSPANLRYAIAVVAHDRHGDRWENSPDATGAELTISGPGHELVQTTAAGGYAIRSGTSGAAPLVAAVFALARWKHPDAAWDQIINLVLQNTDDAGPEGKDDDYGWGIVDPLAVLDAPLPASVETTEPVPATTDRDLQQGYPDDGEPPLWVQHTITLSGLALVIGGVIVIVIVLRRRRRRGMST